MLFLDSFSFVVRETKEKGRGLFTTKSLPAGKVIGDYTGLIIHPRDTDRYEKGEHFYLMYYHNYASIFPDFTKSDLYLINHSCTPNCWIYSYKGHTLFFTLRNIFPGEELTISYLLSPKSIYDEPCTHACYCNSAFCTTSMHLSEERFTSWQKTYNEIAKKTKRERIRYGKELRPLPDYPLSIPDHPSYTLFGTMNEKAKVLEEQTIPSKEELRRVIRESGRMLSFPKVELTVAGVIEEEIITIPYENTSTHLQ